MGFESTGQGLSDFWLQAIGMFVQAVFVIVAFVIAINKRMSKIDNRFDKTDGRIDLLTVKFDDHEKKDDSRFNSINENVKDKIESVDKKLDIHIADRKVDKQNVYTKLDQIGTDIKNVQIEMAKK